jgi:hypothetical protein
MEGEGKGGRAEKGTGRRGKGREGKEREGRAGKGRNQPPPANPRSATATLYQPASSVIIYVL